MTFRKEIADFFEQILSELFPIRKSRLSAYAEKSAARLFCEILSKGLGFTSQEADIHCDTFEQKLETIHAALLLDIEALYQGDPAAQSHDEIILAYPGFYAIAAHRMAHVLYNQRIPLLPRIISEHAHSQTGIDIHPGATIGSHLCIDHGSGVVIGQTTIIGNHVKIYQGVTLGALSIKGRQTQGKRHPTIEDHVVIYAQATILGGDTVIGKHSIIGGNVWLTSSVAPGSKIYYQSSHDHEKKHH